MWNTHTSFTESLFSLDFEACCGNTSEVDEIRRVNLFHAEMDVCFHDFQVHDFGEYCPHWRCFFLVCAPLFTFSSIFSLVSRV